MKPHPKPYKFQWINNDGDIIFKNQVSVSIFTGKYEEEVTHDVVPMEVSHILLACS